MNIILCDDELIFLSSIEEKINIWIQENKLNKHIIIHSFTSSEDMLNAFNHGMQIDALFLDIQIPGEMNGITVAKEIRKTNEYIPIVFITSYAQYAEDGYVVNALRYLRKPITQEMISECMNLIWRRWNFLQTEGVVLDLPTQSLYLPISSILYAEMSGHACIIQTTDREEGYKFRQTMDYLLNKLPNNQFVQCHRSFLINLMYVRHITRRSLTMADGSVIQIGRKFQQSLMQRFRSYYLIGGDQ